MEGGPRGHGTARRDTEPPEGRGAARRAWKREREREREREIEIESVSKHGKEINTGVPILSNHFSQS